jgi:ribosomal protein L34
MPKTIRRSQQYKGSKTGQKGGPGAMAKSVFNPTSGDGKVKSAKEMGLKAESMGIIKKKKTHKGRKIIENREAKIQENPKKSIMVKGNKTS